MSYADTNDRDIRAKQKSSPADSEAFSAASSPASESDQGDATEPDPHDVNVLPGTGGPDDVGDVEVDPDELNMSGH